MRTQVTRVPLVLVCLAFGFGLLGASSPAAAADKKKSAASKKHHKTHHKSSKPAKAVGSSGGAAAAPAEEADEDDGDESADNDAKDDDAKAKPKSKAQTSGDKASDKASDDKREASDEKAHGDGDEDGDSTVVRRKAKRPAVDEAGAPVALELTAGPRVLHRTFDFYDPLSNHVPTAMTPFAYDLKAAPAPFVDLGLYPAAFATRGLAASFGIIARYERLVATKTTDASGTTFNTLGQQLELGLRGRLPLGDHEIGLTATYGKHTFHVAESDPGPAAGSTVPNVDYTFAGIDVDGRVRISPIEIGAHVGTRLVFDTGSLGQNWFSTTKTTSIDAGLSFAYKVTPLFAVVAGADFIRYAFDFNPVTPGNAVVAGGAVDQYFSGFLALRVSLSGS